MKCDHIPQIIEYDSYDGNYEEYENDIYAAYQSTFESQEFSWGEKPIRQKKHPMFKGKSGTFWHIISSGDSEESRIPDFRRYERVTWPAYILSYCKDNCDKILVWKNQRKNKTRILLWCQDIDYLVVLDERKDFFQLYDILLQGEETYNNRQAVCRLLNNLASVDFSMAPPPEVSSLSISERLIKGEFAVRSAIRSVLIYEISHTENAEFNLFLPPSLKLTIDFMEFWLDNRSFTVNELLCFETSPNAAAKNLELLHAVIPLCLASRGHYKPYYFHETPKAASLSPMGYYIISPHYLILFSEDLSTAQILESEDLISYYRNFFKNLLLQCEPLTQCSSDMAEVLNEYISVAAPDSLHIIMPQPCIGRYISHNIVEKYLNRSQLPLEPYLSLIDQHYSFLRQVESNYYTIFTEEGLQNLIESRTCDDSPKELIPYLDQSDVCDFLKKLYQEIETGTVLGLIARPTQLHLPDYLSIYINPQTGLHIYTTLKFVFGSYCCNIHITEESIRSLFLDFFHSLPESNLVYSREDTLYLLKHHINQLEASIKTK